jgi:hypothetical protein
MQASGMYITAGFKLSTGMQRGHNNFQCGLLVFGMLIHGNASAIVGNAKALSRFVQLHSNLRGIAIHGFINGII